MDNKELAAKLGKEDVTTTFTHEGTGIEITVDWLDFGVSICTCRRGDNETLVVGCFNWKRDSAEQCAAAILDAVETAKQEDLRLLGRARR